MSEIERLLGRYCPEGVEFRPLGDVGRLVRGNGMPKSDFTDSGVGAIHYGQIYTYYGTWTTETISHVAPETAQRLAHVETGDLIITNTSENLDDVGKAVAWLGEGSIVTGGHATVFKHNQDPKFIAYWLQSPSFQRQKRRLASGTKVIDVSAKNLATVRMPVPPLEVQREIVTILDRMERLEAELEAELEARRRQYAHYRDALLTFDEAGGVRWVPMGEACTNVSSGGTPTSGRSEYYGGTIPWLRTQEVDYKPITRTGMSITDEGLRNSSAKWIPANCVIVAMYGATAAKVAVNSIPLTTNQACCNLEIDPSKADVRFVFHWLSHRYAHLRALGEGSQSNLSLGKVKGYPLPLPSLAEQRRIAAILDFFDALVNDLSSGLPAEIAARRKQYEFYRDRLLTFEELAA